MTNKKLMKTGLWSLLGLSGILLATISHADAPKISGFVDTTYNYDINKPASRVTAMKSFDRRTDSFLLNAAQVNIEGSKDGIGYYAELAFGTDPSIYRSAGSGNDPAATGSIFGATPSSTTFDVQEAYLTYKCPITGIPADIILFTDSNISSPPSNLTACTSVSFIMRIAEESACLELP